VAAFQCPPGHVILSVSNDDGPPVFVDATSEQQALRQIHGVGLSPIGEFDDFRSAPQPVQDGFVRVAACVERDPSLPLGKPSTTATPPAVGGHTSAPWRLLAGLALAALALVPRQRPRRLPWKNLALLVALGAATLALARTLVGPTFFHQNGHGPNWIGYALGDPCSYGPGFEELFSWAARLRPEHPESLVFACNAVLAAACPPLAWIVARRIGAPRALAWAIAAALAVDPLLLRMAFTESYYVATTALLLGATAVALSAPTLRPWSPRLLLASAAAGLLLAQVARVHPVGWVAVAVMPLAHLARRGSLRRGLRHALASGAVIAVVLAAAAGPAIVDVLQGPIGAQYLPEMESGSSEELARSRQIVTAGVAAIVLLMALTRQWRGRWPVRAGLVVVVLAAAGAGTSLLHVDVDWVRAAHARMFLAGGVAAGVGLLGPLLRRWAYGGAAPALVVAFGLANVAGHWRWVTDLPTDALELREALAWRERLPPGTRLVTVETAGVMALQLPLYAAHRDERRPVVRLDAHGAPPALGSFGDRVYYYRSSLCSTPRAHPFCDVLERSAALEPVDVRELPARPSTRATVYDEDPVPVGLYRALTVAR
jgi:hypothetical protein